MLKTIVTCVALALFVSVPVACSDDDDSPAPDSAVKNDMATAADGSATQADGSATQGDGSAPQGDGSATQADGGAKLLNCMEITDCLTTCNEACGSEDYVCTLGCIDTCKVKGCKEAQTVFGAVNDCTTQKCLALCMSGDQDACNKCVEKECKTEVAACAVQTCP